MNPLYNKSLKSAIQNKSGYYNPATGRLSASTVRNMLANMKAAGYNTADMEAMFAGSTNPVAVDRFVSGTVTGPITANEGGFVEPKASKARSFRQAFAAAKSNEVFEWAGKKYRKY